MFSAAERPIWPPVKVGGAEGDIVQHELAGFLWRLGCQSRRTGSYERCPRPLGVNALDPELHVTVLARDPADSGIESPAPEQPRWDIGRLHGRHGLADDTQLPFGLFVHGPSLSRRVGCPLRSLIPRSGGQPAR